MTYVNPISTAESVSFTSAGTRCAAWWTVPDAPRPWPAVVLVHGLGAAHVFTTAARDREIAAAVVQCPIIDGLSAARAIGLRGVLAMTGPITRDLLARALRRPRPTIPIVGRPGERAFVTAPGAAEGWNSLIPESAPAATHGGTHCGDPRRQAQRGGAVPAGRPAAG